jgi:hypothetical protein
MTYDEKDGGSRSEAGRLIEGGTLMADEPENPALEPEHPALLMLLRLEGRLNSLAGELEGVRSRLAYVEDRLARLEAERAAIMAPDTLMQQAIEYALEVSALSPPLSAREDEDMLEEIVRQLRGRRTAIHVLSEAERNALEEAWRNGVASQEEVEAFLKRRGIG